MCRARENEKEEKMQSVVFYIRIYIVGEKNSRDDVVYSVTYKTILLFIHCTVVFDVFLCSVSNA